MVRKENDMDFIKKYRVPNNRLRVKFRRAGIRKRLRRGIRHHGNRKDG